MPDPLLDAILYGLTTNRGGFRLVVDYGGTDLDIPVRVLADHRYQIGVESISTDPYDPIINEFRYAALRVGFPMLEDRHFLNTRLEGDWSRIALLFTTRKENTLRTHVSSKRVRHIYRDIPHVFILEGDRAVRHVGLIPSRFGPVGDDSDWVCAITDHHVDPVLRGLDLPLLSDHLGQIERTHLRDFPIRVEPI